MQLEVFKYICAGIIVVLTFIGAVLPIFIRTRTWSERLESLASGVFLGAGLAHLLAEGIEDISESIDTEYPVGYAIVVSTFVILTIVSLLTYTESDALHFHEKCSLDIDDEDVEENYELEDVSSSSATRTTATTSSTTEDVNKNNKNNKDPLKDINKTKYSANENQNSSSSEEGVVDNDSKEVVEKSKISLFGDKPQCLAVSTLTFYIVIGIHAFITGFALGILDDWKGVIAVISAIAGHKTVEAFAVGMVVLRDHPTRTVYWLLMIFSMLLTPVGVISATLTNKDMSQAVQGILKAFSAGTFLFVGCEEWNCMFAHKSKWNICEKVWHLSLFTTGALWMLLIAIIG